MKHGGVFTFRLIRSSKIFLFIKLLLNLMKEGLNGRGFNAPTGGALSRHPRKNAYDHIFSRITLGPFEVLKVMLCSLLA